MSGVSSLNKKRRLESERSQASGISNLSNVTQFTDLTSEFEESISDSSTDNVNNGISPFTINSEETKAKYPHERSLKRAQKKRKVSRCLGNEDENDETGKRQASLFFLYDNNFSGKSNRATGSSLGNQDFACFQRIQSRAENTNNQSNQGPVRRNTTSQIHGHEADIQRQRMIENHYRHNTAQEFTGRSQSEICLQNSNPHVIPFPSENAYESLQQQTMLKSPAVPKSFRAGGQVDTIVTMPNGGPNYIHPVTQVQTRVNSCDLLDKHRYFTREEDEGLSGDSTYIDVRQNPDAASQVTILSCRSCDDIFFRKGFYLLLVLNILFLLLSVVGLPFLYFANPPTVGTQAASVCVKCDFLPINERNSFKTKDNNCCGSTEEIFWRSLETTGERIKVIEKKIQGTTSLVPILQLRADKVIDLKIKWRERGDNINISSFRDFDDRTSVGVPKTGYYYIYSRMHYRKTDGNDYSPFTIGHKVMKSKSKSMGVPKPIDEIVQRCLPKSNSGDVRHTNQIGSVQFLEESDRVFIQLNHEKYFDPNESILGLFLIGT